MSIDTLHIFQNSVPVRCIIFQHLIYCLRNNSEISVKWQKKDFYIHFFNPIYIQQIMFNSFWCLENHVSIIFITSQPYLFNIQLIMSEWHSYPTNHIYVLFMSWKLMFKSFSYVFSHVLRSLLKHVLKSCAILQNALLQAGVHSLDKYVGGWIRMWLLLLKDYSVFSSGLQLLRTDHLPVMQRFQNLLPFGMLNQGFLSMNKNIIIMIIKPFL